MKLGSYSMAKVYKPGKYEIWAQTEVKSEIFMDVQPGKVYFIKCKVKMGMWVGQPELVEVDPRQGWMEINKLTALPNQQVVEVY